MLYCFYISTKEKWGIRMNEKLYQLLQKAELDFELRKRIWEAKDAKDPALALCELCTDRKSVV